MSKTIHKQQYKKLLSILVQARLDSGLSQVQLADLLGTPQSLISKVERGERRLDVIEFLDFTAAIGVDPVKILKALQNES